MSGEVVKGFPTKRSSAVDREILEKVVSAIEDGLKGFNSAVERTLAKMRLAVSAEEVMYYKQRILQCFVEHMPLGALTCYFCLAKPRRGYSCEECPYTEHHGKCTATGSTYARILSARGRLLETLGDYYRGEEYGDEQG